jgi:hypothetical protein
MERLAMLRLRVVLTSPAQNTMDNTGCMKNAALPQPAGRFSAPGVAAAFSNRLRAKEILCLEPILAAE